MSRPVEGIDEAGWGELLASQRCTPFPGELPPEAIAAAELETGTEFGSHVFGSYRNCQRKSQLHRAGLVRVGRLYDRLDYFGIGGAVHAVLSYGWAAMQRGAVVDPLDALRAATQRPAGIDLDTYEEAERLCTAYYAHYGFPDWRDGVKILDVEVLLRDDSSFAVPYTARLDLVAEIAGEIVLVDTKTRAKSLPKDREGYARDLRTREQFLGQAFLAMQRYGLAEPPPVVVNVIVKTKIPAFDRLRVNIRRSDVERWAENHAAEATAGLDGSLMNYSSCAPEIGSKCEFIDYCHGDAEQRARGFAFRKEKL